MINVLNHLPTLNTDFSLLGDLNFSHVKWDTRETTGGTPGEKFQARQLTFLVETTKVCTGVSCLIFLHHHHRHYFLEKCIFRKDIGINWFTNRVVDEWSDGEF